MTSDLRTRRKLLSQCNTAFAGVEFVRVDDVTGGLGHFFAADIPPAVDQQAGHLGVAKAHGVEHTEPVNAVGGDQDIFADDVHRAAVSGPEGGEIR